MPDPANDWSVAAHRDPWDPVAQHEPPAAKKPGKGVAMPATLSVEVPAEMVAVVKDLAATQEALGAELHQWMEAMGAWMQTMQRVVAAPRRVSLKRDADGLATEAVSEIVE